MNKINKDKNQQRKIIRGENKLTNNKKELMKRV